MKRRKPSPRDRELGMDRAISRRDFVQGVAQGGAGMLGAGLLGAGLLSPVAAAGAPGSAPPGAQDRPGYYPPTLTGLRGSHAGSFEAAHALRDGMSVGSATLLDEQYDLVIVGAGISGLSAAHFYLTAHPAARVLLLDNHDDFGGHAKRNEFHQGGHLALMNGGTLEIDSPRPYGPVADGVLRALGIDAEALSRTAQHPEFYSSLGLGTGIFFDRATFGADHLAVGYRQKSWAGFLAAAPLTAAAKADVERVENGSLDYFPGWTPEQKKRYLTTISYVDYLSKVMQVDPAVVAMYRTRTQGEWGVGGDAVSAADAWGIDLPGFKGLNLPSGSVPGMGFTPAGYADTGGSTRMHFPDGNATIARSLVRRLIPRAVPGTGVEDVITATVDYARLDEHEAPVRLRLSSIVLRAQNTGNPQSPTGAAVTYIRDGRLFTVRAAHCVLACYNGMIPYLCPELPERQKAALHSLVKTPLVYTTVAVRNWQAFMALKIHQVHAPGGFHTGMRLNPTVDIGAYRSTRSPQEPNLIWMTRTPCKPGFTEHEQNIAGRTELLAMPFDVFEREIRAQLGATLAGGGFDPAVDITGITVNRWPHGYAPENNSLFEPLYAEADKRHVIGRAPFGRIAIANSDAGGGAYTNVAMEQGYRAVQEILGG
jgi:spermidine dehydrogenase